MILPFIQQTTDWRVMVGVNCFGRCIQRSMPRLSRLQIVQYFAMRLSALRGLNIIWVCSNAKCFLVNYISAVMDCGTSGKCGGRNNLYQNELAHWYWCSIRLHIDFFMFYFFYLQSCRECTIGNNKITMINKFLNIGELQVKCSSMLILLHYVLCYYCIEEPVITGGN